MKVIDLPSETPDTIVLTMAMEPGDYVPFETVNLDLKLDGQVLKDVRVNPGRTEVLGTETEWRHLVEVVIPRKRFHQSLAN